MTASRRSGIDKYGRRLRELEKKKKYGVKVSDQLGVYDNGQWHCVNCDWVSVKSIAIDCAASGRGIALKEVNVDCFNAE